MIKDMKKFMVMPIRVGASPLVGPAQQVNGVFRWQVKDWGPVEYEKIRKIIESVGGNGGSLGLEKYTERLAESIMLALPDREWSVGVGMFFIEHRPPAIITPADVTIKEKKS